MRNMTEGHPDPERKTVIRFYSVLAAALVLMMVPNILAAVVALLMFAGVLIAAYIVRSDSEEGDLRENHCTYIIRTIWISGLLTLVTMGAASAYMLPRMDDAPLQPCLDQIMADAESLKNESAAALSGLMQPCMDTYIEVNFTVLAISMLIGAGPVLLYFVIRFTRGLSRALGGWRVSKPKSWF